MKHLTGLLLALTLMYAPVQLFAALISTGEQLSFQFVSTDFIEPSTSSNTNGAQFSYLLSNSHIITPDGLIPDPGLLETGESIKIDYYQHLSDSAPFSSTVVNGSSTFSDNYIEIFFDFFGTGEADLTPWQDLEGRITLTVLAGEIEVISSNMRIYQDGLEYYSELTPTAVPVPAAFWLLLSGLVGLLYRVKK